MKEWRKRFHKTFFLKLRASAPCRALGSCLMGNMPLLRSQLVPSTNWPVITKIDLMQHVCTHNFCSNFRGTPGLASCPFDFQSPVILILSILLGQAETHNTLLYCSKWDDMGQHGILVLS